MRDRDVDDRLHAVLRQSLHDIGGHARLHACRDDRGIGAIGEQGDGARLLFRRAPQVLDRVTAGTVDADHDDVGLQDIDARREVVGAVEPRQENIAGIAQSQLHDLGAGGIVVDQHYGQRF